MSLTIDIADVVTHELNTAPDETFLKEFTATRTVMPEYSLADLSELKVAVVPKAIDISGATRSVSQHDVSVDIGIQQKVSGDLEQCVCELSDLVQQTAEYLQKRPLANANYAVWVRTQNDPVYSPEHLFTKRVFTSVLTLTYRALK